jgi:hypothetical protein
MLTPELRSSGPSPFRERQGALSQTELERWSGASSQPPIPTTANHYLFSTLGPLPRIAYRVVDRRLALLVVAGAVLAMGLLAIYLRPLRHPAVLFVVGVAVAALAAYSPDAAWRISQSAAIGLGLVAVAALFRASVSRRRQGRVVLQASPSASRAPVTTTAGPMSGGGSLSGGAPIPVSSTGPIQPPDSRRSHRDSSQRGQAASAPPVA